MGVALHRGSRIVFGSDGFLYITMGDAGNRPVSQDLSSLNGKILRLTAEGEPAPGNPFGDHIWSLGHRNPQGLVFHPNGMLYSAEHGQRDEDELNLIEPGRNYGWPTLEGFCSTPEEEAYCAANDVVEPLHTWSPTVGIGGVEVYVGDAIEGWDGDLLAVSLRGEALYHIGLSEDGRRAVSIETILEGEYGRLRDVLVGPDGEVYIATSNRDGRGDPTANDDRILRLTAPVGR
jgi:glucose/arabinose dehydrogenase